ncbi:MAG TPA: hypothetical protein VF996_01665 [Candidatus Saccharimonadales bacterium]|jgi:hypothetical protein
MIAKKKSAKAKGRWKFWQGRNDNSEVPSAWRLFGSMYVFFVKNWKVFSWLIGVYAVLYFLLVRAAPQIDLSEYDSTVDELLGEGFQATKTLTLGGLALASASTGTSQVQLVYGLVLLVVFSLAYIWTIRHITAGKEFNFRDTLYRSQTPAIPYLSLIMLMTVQLLPFAVGSFVFTIINSQNIAVGPWENLLFVAVWLSLSLLSAYWVVNSLMASYAVTLPGMYPMSALRATSKLVKHRRWFLLKKILFLPIVLFLWFALIFLFLVAVAPSIVFWFYDVSLIIALPAIHIYYYQLYRSLV